MLFSLSRLVFSWSSFATCYLLNCQNSFGWLMARCRIGRSCSRCTLSFLMKILPLGILADIELRGLIGEDCCRLRLVPLFCRWRFRFRGLRYLLGFGTLIGILMMFLGGFGSLGIFVILFGLFLLLLVISFDLILGFILIKENVEKSLSFFKFPKI